MVSVQTPSPFLCESYWHPPSHDFCFVYLTDVPKLQPHPGLEKHEEEEEEEEESDGGEEGGKKKVSPGSKHRVQSGPRTPNPYAADNSSLMFPILVAFGVFIPTLFCLCRLWAKTGGWGDTRRTRWTWDYEERGGEKGGGRWRWQQQRRYKAYAGERAGGLEKILTTEDTKRLKETKAAVEWYCWENEIQEVCAARFSVNVFHIQLCWPFWTMLVFSTQSPEQDLHKPVFTVRSYISAVGDAQEWLVLACFIN